MTMSTNGHEHDGTYFADRKNIDERTRLVVQDQMTTEGMGGVLSEQPDPSIFHSILDVACGTGGWLINVAQSLPDASWLAGVDINREMINYARKQASAQGLESGRVEFRTMDGLLMLEFPDNSFDLVNQRFGDSYLRTWDWSKTLGEFVRVTKLGGVIRLTEAEHTIQSNSPALTRLFEIGTEAFYRSGHSFHPHNDGVTSQLPILLHQFGLQNIQTQAHFLDYQAGTPRGQHFYDDMSLLFRVAVPFYRKWMRLPDDFDQIYKQALHEMQQTDFHATHILLTAWGTNAMKSDARPTTERH